MYKEIVKPHAPLFRSLNAVVLVPTYHKFPLLFIVVLEIKLITITITYSYRESS